MALLFFHRCLFNMFDIILIVIKNIKKGLSLSWKPILAVLAVFVVFYIWTLIDPGKNTINRFTGQLVGFQDNAVTVHGVFDSKSSKIPEDLSSPRDFTFRVDGSTKIEKEVIAWPITSEEWEVLGDSFDIKDLPRQRTESSFEGLKTVLGLVYVDAKFSASISEGEEPVASYIIFRVHSLPPI